MTIHLKVPIGNSRAVLEVVFDLEQDLWDDLTSMERFAKLAALSLNHVLESPIQASELEMPPDPKMGDFAFPCFKLAKQFKLSPQQLAQKFAKDLIDRGLVPRELTVAPVGPYVNFTAQAELVLTSLLKDILAGEGLGHYGSLPAKSRGSWVIEFSSPNVAKPMNIYHLRPTALGAALDRVGRYRGFDVTSINHLGDWGKQYGMLAVAFRLFGSELPASPTINDLVELYVRINQMAEADPSIEEEAKAAFVKLEQGDEAITALWKKCVDISMREFNRIYARLNVHFDHIWGESFYKTQLTPLLDLLKQKKLLIESEGAWVVPVTDAQGKELPPCIMQKSDGATIYATRDVAAAIYRMEKIHFDRMTYIVGGEQKLHFQQIFAVLKKMDFEWSTRCEHVPTGLYRFKDAKMSTRKGNFVTLEEVLTLARDKVSELMAKRLAGDDKPESAAQINEETIEAVAIGAVVFHDLYSDPAKDIEFDVDRIVDFEGETGPYLQYAHTRCLSILRKAQTSGELSGTPKFEEKLVKALQAPQELALVKMLGQFPLHLERTLKFAKASQLAHYLIDLTKAFGLFYRECHVLGQGPELTPARLMLVEATRRVLAQGLELLGIPRPEKM